MNLLDIFILGTMYLLGGFPTGVVLSKRKYGLDVREMGSGNIGATNVTRVFGWYAGLIVFVVDFLKGYVPLWILVKYYPVASPWLYTGAGLTLVVGHCFSPYLRLKGGKGVATSLGCLTFFSPIGSLIGVSVYSVALAITKISAVGSLAGVLAMCLYVSMVKLGSPVTVFVILVSVIVISRHHQNIRRLIKGA